MTGRERFFAYLDGKPTDHLLFMPITMHYAGDQIGAKYGAYATDYRILVEGQMAVAERFHTDYVSAISDPAVEASDLGATVLFPPDAPPAIDESNALLADKARLSTLVVPDPGAGRRMSNRLRAVAGLREKAGDELAVEGWIEGPCAEAADLRGINHLMMDFMDDPDFVRDLFEFVVEMELRFAKAQVDAGADVIGIGDAAASLVGPRIYNEFVQPCEQRMVDGVHALGAKARLHICGNTRRCLEGMGRLGADIVDLDFLSPLAEGRAKMGLFQVLLGNIDPVRVLRDGTPETVYDAIAQCHREAGGRYIVGAGCEVPRGTPPENLIAMAAYAQEHGG